MLKWIVIILFSLSALILQEDKFKSARSDMVRSQLVSRGINNKDVLKVFREVQRHRFVPERYINNAYDDSPLPIGYGQTISQPYIVAYMTEIIQPGKNDKVLEIGTGSGYQAAVLSGIVNEVYTVEIIPELEKAASQRLKKLGYKNIFIKAADGYFGWKEFAPFDAIVVTAAAEYIPPPLIEQLKDGGRMIIPVGSPFLTQQLMLIEKQNGEIKSESLMPVRFVPFTRK